ncbi:MAG: hypothetical protein KAQ92_08045 [Candidatus Aenigmarchaeota archaeon]|nr:hypothetical protein [Candidatus Aenigmarchaeota archaeon]
MRFSLHKLVLIIGIIFLSACEGEILRKPSAGDTPGWLDGTPDIINITKTTIDLRLKTDRNATIYFSVVNTYPDNQSPLQLKTGIPGAEINGNFKINANEEIIYKVSNLTEDTQYYIFFLAEDLSNPPIEQEETTFRLATTLAP